VVPARFLAAFAVLALAGPAFAQPAKAASARLGAPGLMPVLRDASQRPAPSPDTVTGTMFLEVVVGTAGRVDHLRVVRGLAPASDKAAAAAVSLWKFQPAMEFNRPSSTLVGLELTYARPDNATGSWKVSARVTPLPRTLPPESVNVEIVPLRAAGVVNPGLLREVRPDYSSGAMREKIQGSVVLEVVVLPDGTVGAAAVKKSLDRSNGLDNEALIAASYWLFAPATRDGKPVATTVTLELTFKMF
jgi:TonB family protein